MTEISVTVDAIGLDCPMPLLKAKQALNRLQEGDLIEVFATDAGSVKDFQAFCNQTTHELILSEESKGTYRYQIRKGKKEDITQKMRMS